MQSIARRRVSMLLNHINKPVAMNYCQQSTMSNVSCSPNRIVRFLSMDDIKDNNPPKEYYGILTDNQDAAVGTKVSLLEYTNIYDTTTYKQSTNYRVIGKLLAPIDPVNIFCIGLNYKSHASESNMVLPQNPVIFAKPTTSVINPNESIVIPSVCIKGDPNDPSNPGEMDYEVELAIIIGKKCKNISEDDALKYIFGYSIAHDVSARVWQLNKDKGGGQWIRGKSFDTFCPFGPCVLLESQNFGSGSGQNLNLYTKLNGKTLQNSNTNQMIFNIKKLVSFLSQGTTLLPGTIILSGTPEGIGFARKPPIYLKNGDNVIVGIQGIGELVNDVKDE